jgi:uncharacterized protein
MRRFFIAALICLMVPLTGHAAPPPPSAMIYVPVDDGTEIAVRVFYPNGYDATKKYPVLLEVEGYGGAGTPNDSSFVGNPNYIVVGMSLRGTGCSAGTLELFSHRSSRDGAFIIDEWIPKQPWSNGSVGIYGHSYGGLEGFLTAAAVGEFYPDNTSLKAVAVSGLIDDFYRGILYPGGISNYGFPVLWGAGVRPIGEHQGNLDFFQNDEHCRTNYLSHQGSSTVPTPQIALDTYGSPFATPDSWSIRNALLTHINGIKVPIQLGQQYQDEQTGPRGGHVLWENLPDVPKRLTVSTGMHNPNDPTGNKKDWLDCWIVSGGDTAATSSLGRPCADVLDPRKKVLLYFESMGSNRLAPYVASDWPLPETEWTRLYLRGDSTLRYAPGNDAPTVYASTGTGRHMTQNLGHAVPGPADTLAPYGFTTGLPDTARYTMNFAQDTAIAGPLELSLYAIASTPDVDFWAEILDYDTVSGATTFVQRGLLRASMRTLDEAKSQKTPGGDIYRPYHPYLFPDPIVPGTAYHYDIEVFPLGHVWRAGHQMVLQLHAPPANDPISTYAYEPNAPSVVQILQDADHPTSLLVPFMPVLPPYRATPPACGAVIGEGCITPAVTLPQP